MEPKTKLKPEHEAHKWLAVLHIPGKPNQSRLQSFTAQDRVGLTCIKMQVWSDPLPQQNRAAWITTHTHRGRATIFTSAFESSLIIASAKLISITLKQPKNQQAVRVSKGMWFITVPVSPKCLMLSRLVLRAYDPVCDGYLISFVGH